MKRKKVSTLENALEVESLHQETENGLKKKLKKKSTCLSREDVLKSIENVITHITYSLEKTGDATISFPSRHEVTFCSQTQTNQQPSTSTTLTFKSKKTNKTFVVMMKILDLAHELLCLDIHTTKRDIYYTDVNLFGKQQISDNAIENVASMLGIPRYYLNIVATEKGLVAGDVMWKEKNFFVDCRDYKTSGRFIPCDGEIRDLQSNAKFVLIVEDHATFRRCMS
eukprot:TRINITY_DN2664_c0_g1_i4.p1 TRINITY_DN2664_c0_g1~~TRINITY_DN2664_c0_g1_i4.p1  ORF type:complete len:225 (-),score=32.98 TRINITY_DN2664_c0_g1_i4:523-1197(-)